MKHESLKLALETSELAKVVLKQVNRLVAENNALKKRLTDHAMQEVQKLGQEIEQEPAQRKPLAEEFGIVGYVNVGQQSIQVIFEDRSKADQFKTAHGIKENK